MKAARIPLCHLSFCPCGVNPSARRNAKTRAVVHLLASLRLQSVLLKASVIVCSVVLLHLVIMPRAAFGAERKSDEQRFVDGLTERKLFSLAELACQQRLADTALTPREHVTWIVELIRVMSLHAANAPPNEQKGLWRAAHDVAERFDQEHPDQPRGLLVALQDALTYLAEGELARLEADVAANPRASFDHARATIRSAIGRLESIDKKLTEQLAAARNRDGHPDTLTADELFSLQNNVRFQLSRALRNQALCYPRESSDRVASLSLAVKQLNATLTQLQPDSSLTWQVYLDLAACYRLLGDFSQAERALAKCTDGNVRGALRAKMLAERARLLIATGQAKRALDELSGGHVEQADRSADLELARLEAMLALWQDASSGGDAAADKQWQQRVTATAAAIEQEYGNYWGRRAKLSVLAVASTDVASGNVAILSSSADELYHKKQYDQAIAICEKAIQLARSAGDEEAADSIELKAAAIEQQLKRYAAAAGRLQRLALAHPSNAQAPARHLQAVWNMAQAIHADPSNGDRYKALLTEHIETWPESETADHARLWLGNLLRSKGQWEAAVSAYRAIRPDVPFYADVVKALGLCWEKWLQHQQRSGESTAPIITDATSFLDAIILGPERRWPERWSAAQLAAALATSKLRLQFAQNGLVDVQRVLQTALEHAPTDDAAWLAEARTLLIAALAGQEGKQQEALQRMQDLGAGSTDRLLQLAQQLAALARKAEPAVRRQIAQLQLAALDRLAAGTATIAREQTQQIERLRADALFAAGQHMEALGAYRQIADKYPNDGTIQMRFADLLLESDDKSVLSDAIRQWQKIAKRVRPNTDDWLKARYCIALALYKRNQPARGKQMADRALAARRLRYLKVTSNVDKTSWKAKVDELLQRCEAADSQSQ